jgi:DNA modification methylase
MKMTPYYDQEGITIYHGDCREVLPEVAFDVAVTDPPYNVGFKYGDAVDDRRRDYQQWCAEWFGMLRVKARAIALTPGTVNVPMWCEIEHPRWILAWHKPAAMGSSPFGVCNWEPILFWGASKRNRGTDVVRAPIIPDKALAGHPCPKPLAWATGTLKLLTDPGDSVVDPFSGSGTVLVGSQAMGLRAIGIEIEERYCEIAAKRLSQGVLPMEAAS